MSSPNIVVGIGGTLSEEDVSVLAQSGANEFYVGYVPACWHVRFGFATSPNRRYWRGASFTHPKQLQRATERAHQHGCRVSVALNEHSYSAKACELAVEILDEAQQLGVDSVIVSDPDLLRSVRERFPRLPVHASGEMGVYNTAAVQQIGLWGATRVILPRHLTLAEIAALSAAACAGALEVEAFIMSERCCFEGGFCLPTHGYLKQHLCNAVGTGTGITDGGVPYRSQLPSVCNEHARAYDEWRSHTTAAPEWLGGECGLCAVRDLARCGVGFFKVVGRGVGKDALVKRIRIVRAAIDYDGCDHSAFCKGLIENAATCEHGYRCYYRG